MCHKNYTVFVTETTMKKTPQALDEAILKAICSAWNAAVFSPAHYRTGI